jgi:hypothetical protein
MAVPKKKNSRVKFRYSLSKRMLLLRVQQRIINFNKKNTKLSKNYKLKTY